MIAEAERNQVPGHEVVALAVEVVDGQGLVAGAAGGEVVTAVLAMPGGRALTSALVDAVPERKVTSNSR